MVRIRSLSRSSLLALPFAALLAACGGVGADGAPNADPTAQGSEQNPEVLTEVVDDGGDTQDPNAPVRVVNGAEAPVDEAPGARDGGREGEDRGFAESAGLTAEDMSAPPPADDDVDTGLASSSDPLVSSRGETLVREAKRNVSWLNEPASYYSHDTYMNESTGTRRTDCSGLSGYILTRVLRAAYDKIPHPGRARPLAEDYYKYFVTRYASAQSTYSDTPRWRRMNQVKNLKPGDVVVWLSPHVGPNTGHIMVVRDYPRPGRASRNEWLVPVIDSTSTPHSYGGAWDSRGTTRNGVGAGTIGLKVDPSTGKPVAYYWTGGKSGTAVYVKVAMARVE